MSRRDKRYDVVAILQLTSLSSLKVDTTVERLWLSEIESRDDGGGLGVMMFRAEKTRYVSK